MQAISKKWLLNDANLTLVDQLVIDGTVTVSDLRFTFGFEQPIKKALCIARLFINDDTGLGTNNVNEVEASMQITFGNGSFFILPEGKQIEVAMTSDINTTVQVLFKINRAQSIAVPSIDLGRSFIYIHFIT
jgi:2-phospho-L-lactate guanylyltransferase (CobY/MobA/RfbA family)